MSSPIWPGGESGITIGIGYDLAHVNHKQFRQDWSHLPKKDLDTLSKYIGL